MYQIFVRFDSNQIQLQLFDYSFDYVERVFYIAWLFVNSHTSSLSPWYASFFEQKYVILILTY